MNSIKAMGASLAFSWKMYYRSSGLWIIAYYLMNLVKASVGLFETYAIKEILNALVAEPMNKSGLILWSCLMIAGIVAGFLFGTLQNLLSTYLSDRAGHCFDTELIERMKFIPFSFLDSSDGKDVIDEVKSLKHTAINYCMRFATVVTAFYTFCGAFVFLIAYHIWFSLLFLVLTVPAVILNVVFSKRAEDLWWEKMPDIRRMSYYRWMLTDATPAKDVRTYDLTEFIRKRYAEEKSEYLSEKRTLIKKGTACLMLAEGIRYSGILVFSIFIVIKAIHGELSVGDVSLYAGYAATSSGNFSRFLTELLLLRQYAVDYLGTLFDFLDMEPEFHEGTESLNSFESLVFDNVSFQYPTGKQPILNGVSFSLYQGEKLSVVGINGAGKTTLVKLMLGFYRPDSGEIRINGKPMQCYRIEDVRRQFSVLFQDFVQYPLQLRFNVAASDLSRMGNDGEIIDALRQSGVFEELEPKLSNGLDSYMKRRFDDNGTEISKGQWQKLSLARAYFKNAPILIFDEPSASLDAEAEDRIFRNFEAISEGKTGIMISHRISAARMATKIIVLDNGIIAEEGTHEELVERGGIYANLYALQRAKYVNPEEAANGQ